jgi:hypothetical protein
MTALLPVILAPPFAQSLQFRRPRPRPLKHSHTHTHTHTHAHTHTHTQAEGFDVRNENALEKLYLSSGNDITRTYIYVYMDTHTHSNTTFVITLC